MTLSNYERMLAGQLHSGADPELFAVRARMAPLKAAVDAVPLSEFAARFEALSRMLRSTDRLCFIHPPFTVDYGCHIHIGYASFVNFGSVWLDSAPITLGKHCAIGPNVQFLAAGHPLRPEERFLPPFPGSDIPFDVACTSAPITLGDYVWVGGGSIILQGVSIGDGAVIGAGSVVTRSVPARMVAVGNPARVVRSVDD